jgi:hypothetical protein
MAQKHQVLLIGLFTGLLLFTLFGQTSFGGVRIAIAIAGSENLVYRSNSGCDAEDIPDTPARVFRDSHGRIHLFSSHFRNRAMIGPNFDHLARDCKIVFQGRRDDDPSAFDDLSWLAGFWAIGVGKTIYALVHNEFHGKMRPKLCPSNDHFKCWYNGIAMAVSHDDGFSFQRQEKALVAAPLYPYTTDSTGRIGPSNPTNIIGLNGYYYFLFVEDVRDSRGRVCVARSDDLADHSSWRAWDGNNFSIIIASNPYDTTEKRSPCHSLPGLISGSVGSITRHVSSGLFVLTQIAAASKNRRAGVYFSTSSDLVHWSTPTNLLRGPTYRVSCEINAIYRYPALIDPDSTDRNFQTIGDRPFLYFVREHAEACHGSLKRDLLRLPIAITTEHLRSVPR